MTLKLIRRRVEHLHSQTRQKLWAIWAGPLAVGGFSVYGIKLVHGVFPILEAAFAFAIVWSLAGVYFLSRGMRLAPMPGDAALSTGLEFYRREIERQRTFYGRALLWSFGPIILALATFILFLVLVSRGKIAPGMPFLILVVLWLAGYFFFRMREQRDLQREIDELKDIESQI